MHHKKGRHYFPMKGQRAQCAPKYLRALLVQEFQKKWSVGRFRIEEAKIVKMPSFQKSHDILHISIKNQNNINHTSHRFSFNTKIILQQPHTKVSSPLSWEIERSCKKKLKRGFEIVVVPQVAPSLRLL